MHRPPLTAARRLTAALRHPVSVRLFAALVAGFLGLGAIAGSGAARPARQQDDVPIPLFDHIIVVIMENHSYDESRVAPFTASLIQSGTSFSNSHAVTHPSQPNYLALWCGNTRVTNDNCPPSGSPYSVQNLGHLCDVLGLRWRAYSEGLPSPGYSGCTADGGLYARKHDPWTDFSTSSHLNERPYSDFALDAADDSLPALSMIVPDLCDDAHNNCGEDPVTHADNWLAANVPQMLTAMGPRGLFILTWDEDDNSTDNHILTLFLSNFVAPDSVCDQHITHYTVLKTICEGLNLPPFAAAASETSITGIWLPETAGVHLPALHPFLVSAAWPNPTRGGISVRVTLPARLRLGVDVVDVRGVRVRDLGDLEREGDVEVTWDGLDAHGRAAPGGVYFLRVSAAGQVAVRKIIRLN